MKRLIFYYSEIMGYNLTVFKSLIEKHDCEILVFHQVAAKLSSFQINNFAPDKLRFIVVDDLSPKEISCISDEYNPDIAYVVGWQIRKYLPVIRRRILIIAGCNIGSGVSLNAYTRCAGNAIEIGCNTWVSSGTHILASMQAEEQVKIGACCDIGPDVLIVTGTHQPGTANRRAGVGCCLPIVIGNGCWIGARSTILGGAVIGDGVVVAAGSIVIPGNYPANTLIAGVPATIKKQLST